jgi:hypothetical protein
LAAILGSVVLSPDVKHEDAGDEEQRHHQDWNWSTEKNKFNKRLISYAQR